MISFTIREGHVGVEGVDNPVPEGPDVVVGVIFRFFDRKA